MPASEAGSRIAELETKRKQLTSGGNLKEKHNNWGSVLLGLGVTFSVLGPVNTYLRTGTMPVGAASVGVACHVNAGTSILSDRRWDSALLLTIRSACLHTLHAQARAQDG